MYFISLYKIQPCFAIEEGKNILYKKISINIRLIEKIKINSINLEKVVNWNVDRLGNIYFLVDNLIEIYDGKTGETLNRIVLKEPCKAMRLYRNEDIYLLSENGASIYVYKKNRFYKIIKTPVNIHNIIYKLDIVNRNVILIETEGGECWLYKSGIGWERYPYYHLVGLNGAIYYYKGGKINIYNERGTVKKIYKIYDLEYNISPLYSIGIDYDETWYLFTEPLGDKNENKDTAEIMALNFKNKIYGTFILPYGWYVLSKGIIYTFNKEYFLEKWEIKFNR